MDAAPRRWTQQWLGTEGDMLADSPNLPQNMPQNMIRILWIPVKTNIRMSHAWFYRFYSVALAALFAGLHFDCCR